MPSEHQKLQIMQKTALVPAKRQAPNHTAAFFKRDTSLIHTHMHTHAIPQQTNHILFFNAQFVQHSLQPELFRYNTTVLLSNPLQTKHHSKVWEWQDGLTVRVLVDRAWQAIGASCTGWMGEGALRCRGGCWLNTATQHQQVHSQGKMHCVKRITFTEQHNKLQKSQRHHQVKAKEQVAVPARTPWRCQNQQVNASAQVHVSTIWDHGQYDAFTPIPLPPPPVHTTGQY